MTSWMTPEAANQASQLDDSGAAHSDEAGCRELDDSRAAGSVEAGCRAGGRRESKPEGERRPSGGAERTKQILVAGIGNAWLRDDGFGGEVAKLLSDRQLPAGVHVIDFGSGGLDLAYEVMRGYDALVLIDVSRQGGTAGTLYVMEVESDDVDGQIEDGQMLDPHGMDPKTVLRFVKYVGGWPGRVFVVACEPEVVEDVGFGLSDAVRGSLARAADVVLETIADLVSDPVRSASRSS
jgi:hydrogenase maturation protease